MMTKTKGLLIILFLFFMQMHTSGWAQKEAKYSLKSGENTLSVDGQTGKITFLANEAHEFVNTEPLNGPLRLHLPLDDYKAHLVEAGQTKPDIDMPYEHTIRMSWADLNGARGKTGISLRIEYRADGKGGFLAQAWIENGSDTLIPQVFFPWIAGLKPIEGNDDQVTTSRTANLEPWQDFGDIDKAKKSQFMKYTSKPMWEQRCGDNYWSGIKWMDYNNDKAGLTLFSHDTTAREEWMVAVGNRYGATQIDMTWYSYPYIRPGEAWQSYLYTIYPHQGNWRYGIKKYTEFAEKAFTPVNTPEKRSNSLGVYSLWQSFVFQDQQEIKYTFKDIPAQAAEAKKAGLTEMVLSTPFDQYFCIPHPINPNLGTEQDLIDAIAETREMGVYLTPFVSLVLINDETIPEDMGPKEEWYQELNLAGQKRADNWNYFPTMIPKIRIRHFAEHAAYYTCPASENWQKAYFDYIKYIMETWKPSSLFYDQSFVMDDGLCFNPLHNHKRPDDMGLALESVLRQTREYITSQDENGILVGEGLQGFATEYVDFTWDWLCIHNEIFAPFHMAFPKSVQCLKTAGDSCVTNRIFAGAYWVDLYMEEGQADLREHPGIINYLSELAAFKKEFLRFFPPYRDAYNYDLYLESSGNAEGTEIWARSHRKGKETLVMVAEKNGIPTKTTLNIDIKNLCGPGNYKLTMYSYTMEKLAEQEVEGQIGIKLGIPRNEIVALHIQELE